MTPRRLAFALAVLFGAVALAGGLDSVGGLNGGPAASVGSLASADYVELGYVDAGTLVANYIDAGILGVGTAYITSLKSSSIVTSTSTQAPTGTFGYVDAGTVAAAQVNAGAVDAGTFVSNPGLATRAYGTANGKYCTTADCTGYVYTDGSNVTHFGGAGGLNHDTFTFNLNGSGLTVASLLGISAGPISIKGNVANGASAVAVNIGSAVALSTDGARSAQFTKDYSTVQSWVTKDGYYGQAGTANASLPTCDSTHHKYEIAVDSTNNTVVFCNGTVWKTVTTN